MNILLKYKKNIYIKKVKQENKVEEIVKCEKQKYFE